MVELNFTFFAQILNFFILILILGKFGFKPILKTMDERKARIESDLDGAEQARISAEALKAEYEAQLQDARAQAQEIVNRAVKEAEQETQAQLEAVRAQIEHEKAVAKQQLAEEREEVIKELRAEVADISIAVASRVISKNLDTDLNAKLINDCIEKLDKKQVGQ